MKKSLIIYAFGLLALLIISIWGINLSQFSSINRGLKNLDKSEREFRQARQEFLLTTKPVAKVLMDFARNKATSKKARIRAMYILGDLNGHEPIPGANKILSTLLPNSQPAVKEAILQTMGKIGSFEGYENVVDILKNAAFEDTGLIRQAHKALREITSDPVMGLRKALRSRDSTVIDSLSTIINMLPSRKGQLYPRLAAYYRAHGQLDLARDYLDRTGWVKKWWVLGGFDNLRMAGLYKDFGPESGSFNSQEIYLIPKSDRMDTARWFPLTYIPDHGEINILNLFIKQLYSIAYFYTYIYSPTQRDAFLFSGSDDGVAAWVNGAEVLKLKVFRGTVPDDDITPIHLSKGVNRLLIKIAQDVGGWGMTVRIADRMGEGFKDLEYSLDSVSFTPSNQSILQAMVTSHLIGDSLLQLRLQDQRGGDSSLLKVLTADSSPSADKAAAAYIIGKLSQALQIKFGERELISSLIKESAISLSSKLFLNCLQALSNIESDEAKEAAQLASSLKSPHARYLARKLFGYYSRKCIISSTTGDEGLKSLATLADTLMSYQSNDAWVHERLLKYYTQTGNTAKVKLNQHALSFPEVWQLYTNNWAVMSSLSSAIKEFFTKGDIESDKVRKQPYKRILSGGSMNYAAILFNSRYSSPLRGGRYGLLTVEFDSPKSGEAFLTPYLPFIYSVYSNGALVGQSPIRDQKAYYLGQAYERQPLNFDIDEYKVKIKKGTNRLVFAIRGYWDNDDILFRCGFKTADGEVIKFQGNKALW